MTFTKYTNAPVFGNKETGTVFDGYVWIDNGRYRMDFSWREKRRVQLHSAMTESIGVNR